MVRFNSQKVTKNYDSTQINIFEIIENKFEKTQINDKTKYKQSTCLELKRSNYGSQAISEPVNPILHGFARTALGCLLSSHFHD